MSEENLSVSLSPARFGAAFKAFMDAVLEEAVPAGGALLERLQTHLGGDVSQVPIVTEEFDAFEHPNLQVALDACLGGDGRKAELVGVAAEHKRYMAFGLSDLVGVGPGRARLVEGPVDYVNFHLADDRVLACVQFGLYFVEEGEARLVVFVAGPSDQGGPRQKLRVEVMTTHPEAGRGLLTELMEAMRRLNVYRGHVISLAPGDLGMGP